MLEAGEEDLKVPAWLNDVTLYHNRGDTTFVGENSYYGDFFGLDDLFTEHPTVVEGMIDIYKTWIADFGIDGFRIDTMKHVDDEFWQQFGPEVLEFAHQQGKTEVLHVRRGLRQHQAVHLAYTSVDGCRPCWTSPSRTPRRSSRPHSAAASSQAFFAADDWYTDADSNVYQLPTFLGNHDMGRIGSMFVRRDNPGAGDAEWVARDRLAHELMYLLARQPGGVLRRRAGLHRQRRRPGCAADAVRQPGAGLPR